MTAHLIKMHRFINGEGVGLGKSIESIAAAAYLKEKHGCKIMVMGTKSTTYQWKTEGFDEFTTLRTHVMTDTYKKMKGSEARLAQVRDFLTTDEWDVLICKYTSLVGRTKELEGEYDEWGYPIEKGQREELSQEVRDLLEIVEPHGENLILICDEAQKFKSTSTQIRRMILFLQSKVGRVWAMTATVIQNSLDEFYSIAAAIGIRPFGNMEMFRDHFCKYEMTYIGNGREKPTLKGYKNVKEFKIGMRPFYLGRSQAQVKEPLPQLTTIYHPIDLDAKQVKMFEDIKSKKLKLPPSITKVAGEILVRERDADNRMTMLSVMQLISNNTCLIDPTDKKAFFSKALSPKEEALLELLDGQLAGEKVLVFTKSRKWIDRFEYLCKNGYFTNRPFLRITGAEDEKQRDINKSLFQTNPDYDLMFINAAIMEGANLQQSAHMIILDAPWGWGALIQLVGRMVRMSSPHSACTLHIILAKGTIDEYVIETLKGKKGVFEIILGESHSAGLLDSGNDLDLSSGMETMNDDKEFRELLTAHVKTTKMGAYLKGELLAEAIGQQEDYVMSFEKKTEPSITKKRKPFEFSDKW
jgi:SNF2 family DNA or RNA helicase